MRLQLPLESKAILTEIPNSAKLGEFTIKRSNHPMIDQLNQKAKSHEKLLVTLLVLFQLKVLTT